MKKHFLSRLTLLLTAWVLTLCSSCSEQEAPNSTAPTLVIGTASVSSRTTATISGTITLTGSTEITECGFIYSTISTFPEEESIRIPLTPSTSSEFYEAELTGLAPNTEYFYCLYASNGYNQVQSETGSFTTAADGVPSFSEVTCTARTETSLTIRCSMTDDGGYDLLDLGFCYKAVVDGDDSAPDRNDNLVSIDIANWQEFTATLDGLQPNTTYLISAYGSNQLGYGYSTPLSITTDAANVPSLSATTVTNLTATTAYVEATLTSEGSDDVTEVGFCWSTESNTPNIESNNRRECTLQMSTNTFSMDLDGLTPNTTYHIRAYAINDNGVGYGAVYSFVTPDNTPELSVITENLEYLGYDEAILAGRVQYGTNVIERGFIFGTSANREELIANGTKFEVQTTDEYFTYQVTGLTPSTTYTYCAYAVEEGQEAVYGDIVSFTTEDESYDIWIDMVSADNATSSTVEVSAAINGEDVSRISEKGFCYGSIEELNGEEPTIENSTVTSVPVEDEFSATLTGLNSHTEYLIRAYIKIGDTIFYSGSWGFRTEISEIPDINDNESPDLSEDEETR